MPFRWKDSVKNFRWKIEQVSQLPVAKTEKLGEGLYVMCCPLCGCSHNLHAAHSGAGIFEPYCLVNVFADQSGRDSASWRVLRADWLKRFPEAANFKAIWLVSDQVAGIAEVAPRKWRKQAA